MQVNLTNQNGSAIAANAPQDTDMFTGNINNTKGISLKSKARATSDQIDKTSENFESQFVSELVGTMFSTVDEDNVTGGGTGEEMYKSFLADEYGKIITKAGGVGISDQVKKELLKLQETENHGTPTAPVATAQATQTTIVEAK